MDNIIATVSKFLAIRERIELFVDTDSLEYAIQGRHLDFNEQKDDILAVIVDREHHQYLHLFDLQDPLVSSCAAFYGKTNILRYIKKQVATEWDTDTLYSAMFSKNFQCIKYLSTQGCKVDSNILRFASLYNNKEIVKYINNLL